MFTVGLRIIILSPNVFIILQQLVYFSSHYSHTNVQNGGCFYIYYYYYVVTTGKATTTTTTSRLFFCCFILLRRYRPRLVSSAHRLRRVCIACLFFSFPLSSYRHHRDDEVVALFEFASAPSSKNAASNSASLLERSS